MSEVTGLLSSSAWGTVTTLSVVAVTDIIPTLKSEEMAGAMGSEVQRRL